MDDARTIIATAICSMREHNPCGCCYRKADAVLVALTTAGLLCDCTPLHLWKPPETEKQAELKQRLKDRSADPDGLDRSALADVRGAVVSREPSREIGDVISTLRLRFPDRESHRAFDAVEAALRAALAVPREDQ